MILFIRDVRCPFFLTINGYLLWFVNHKDNPLIVQESLTNRNTPHITKDICVMSCFIKSIYAFVYVTPLIGHSKSITCLTTVLIRLSSNPDVLIFVCKFRVKEMFTHISVHTLNLKLLSFNWHS